ncbi:MAG: DUF86 domain-containing protein, partial [Proteobacteria bacterium]|nr:DUF86 domain-containing protein [Pseudomonadota bacterium]
MTDILENIERIENHVRETTKTKFLDDDLLNDGVERCLERIAEAARKIGDRFDDQYTDINLHALRRLTKSISSGPSHSDNQCHVVAKPEDSLCRAANARKERFDDMIKRFLELIRRGWRKPPGVIARWLVRQARAEWDQYRAPARARALTPERLLIALRGGSLDALWKRLAGAPFPAFTEPVTAEDYDKACPGDAERILKAAGDALEGRVDLLGSGPVTLGRPIPWHQDFKSGHRWPIVMFRRIDVMDLGRDSDVKVPWELSRLQWLIPAGQAYLLTGDEKYAEAGRAVIEDWAAANPLAQGVNWACTMDVALRGITLVWLFRVFHQAAAWSDEGFRHDFLKLVYLHGAFTSR